MNTIISHVARNPHHGGHIFHDGDMLLNIISASRGGYNSNLLFSFSNVRLSCILFLQSQIFNCFNQQSPMPRVLWFSCSINSDKLRRQLTLYVNSFVTICTLLMYLFHLAFTAREVAGAWRSDASLWTAYQSLAMELRYLLRPDLLFKYDIEIIIKERSNRSHCPLYHDFSVTRTSY